MAPGKITIERFAYLNKGTLGYIPELNIYTLERPWLDNQRNVSCIPEGEYDVAPDQEGRYIGYPEVQDVPGRSEIIIHTANHVHQLEGCIAPGLRWSVDKQTPSVWQSKNALERIRDLGARFRLDITHRHA